MALNQQREQREEAKLDASLQTMLHRGPADYEPQEWRCLREQLRLTLLYPGRYVAFRDHYHGEGSARLLVRREVLCASRSLAAVNKHVQKLPKADREAVYIDFVERTERR